MNKKPKIVIIGGGSSALFFAAQLDGEKYDISIYDQMPSLGRKFLVAGYGGLNLSFNEPTKELISRYIPSQFMEQYIERFDLEEFRKWLSSLGIPTFVGTSNRVFPEKGIKPIDVLSVFKKKMENNNVSVYLKHKFVGFENDDLKFETERGEHIVKADYYVWALGGASWKKTGSDGAWLPLFQEKGIKVLSFQASNCAFQVDWSKGFLSTNKGKPLKNVSLSCGDRSKSGEVVITRFGLEGNAIYPLSPTVREQLNETGRASLYIDLKPMWDEEKVYEKIIAPSNLNSRSQVIKSNLNLSNQANAMIKYYVSKVDFLDDKKLAKAIKNLAIEITGIADIDEAISTVGGIDIDELSENLALKMMPNHFAIGEMIDWDAPTGGYLLQGCWSMASYLAKMFDELNT